MNKYRAAATILLLFYIFAASGCDTESEKAIVNALSPIPVEDFFRNPEKTTFKISPAGTYFSFAAPHEGILNISVQNIADGSERRVTDFKDRDVYDYWWVNDETIVFVHDATGEENLSMYSVNVATGEKKGLVEG